MKHILNIKILVIAFYFFEIVSINAQVNKQTNIWYFGRNAGINFNVSPPIPIFDGKISTWEGCATFCDTSGRIQIYTDGQKIWNSNHDEMPNASKLGGDNSATQSGVIMPMPSNPLKLIVFSVDAECGPGGLQYAIVDMTMNNGLGGIESKNNKLLDRATEKVTIIKHCNNIDYWVLSHGCGNSDFYIWLLDSNGIKSEPKIQTIGSKQNSGWDAIGYMKASQDGSWVAVASGYTEDKLELFKFDKNLGILSEFVTFKFPEFRNPYGIEFSPNNSILYFAGAQNKPNVNIYQANLALNNETEILNSVQIVGIGNESTFGALQMASNGKIYITKENSQYLSVIHFPDILGISCNFVEDNLNLGGRIAEFGLPNFVPSYLSTPEYLKLQIDSIPCVSEKTIKIKYNFKEINNIKWFKDQKVIAKDVYELKVNKSGLFTCQIQTNNKCNSSIYSFKDSISIVITNYLNSENILICDGENYKGYTKSGIYRDTFISQNGCDSIVKTILTVGENKINTIYKKICSGDTFLNYSVSGRYIDTLQTIYGCDSIRILELDVLQISKIDTIINICKGESYNDYTLPGKYRDTFESAYGCDSIIQLELIVNPVYTFDITQVLCPNSIFQFYDNPINSSGLYSKSFKTIHGCDSTYNLEIIFIQNEFLGNDIINCTSNEVTIRSETNQTKWFDGSLSNEKSIKQTGLYWASIETDDGCIIYDSINVNLKLSVYFPNVININSESENRYFKPYTDKTFLNDFQLFIYNRWGNVVFRSFDQNEKWDGFFNGKSCNIGVYVYKLQTSDAVCRSVYTGDILLLR